MVLELVLESSGRLVKTQIAGPLGVCDSVGLGRDRKFCAGHQPLVLLVLVIPGRHTEDHWPHAHNTAVSRLGAESQLCLGLTR